MTPDTVAPSHRRPTLSDVLTALAADWDQPRISVGQLILALGDRGLIGLLLILAFANVIPNPPGTSAVLGLPMLYLSWQMMRGGMPWLPQFLAARSFDIDHFRTVVARAMPYLNRVERLLRPRIPTLSTPAAFRLLGAVCLLLSIVLVIALGALERDGVWITGGVLFGIASTVFLASAIVIITRAMLGLLGL